MKNKNNYKKLEKIFLESYNRSKELDSREEIILIESLVNKNLKFLNESFSVFEKDLLDEAFEDLQNIIEGYKDTFDNKPFIGDFTQEVFERFEKIKERYEKISNPSMKSKIFDFIKRTDGKKTIENFIKDVSKFGLFVVQNYQNVNSILQSVDNFISTLKIEDKKGLSNFDDKIFNNKFISKEVEDYIKRNDGVKNNSVLYKIGSENVKKIKSIMIESMNIKPKFTKLNFTLLKNLDLRENIYEELFKYILVMPVKELEQQTAEIKNLESELNDTKEIENALIEPAKIENQEDLFNLFDEPMEDEPMEDEPVEDEPVEDEPVEDEPVEDEPVEDENLTKDLSEYSEKDLVDFANIFYDYLSKDNIKKLFQEDKLPNKDYFKNEFFNKSKFSNSLIDISYDFYLSSDNFYNIKSFILNSEKEKFVDYFISYYEKLTNKDKVKNSMKNNKIKIKELSIKFFDLLSEHDDKSKNQQDVIMLIANELEKINASIPNKLIRNLYLYYKMFFNSIGEEKYKKHVENKIKDFISTKVKKDPDLYKSYFENVSLEESFKFRKNNNILFERWSKLSGLKNG